MEPLHIDAPVLQREDETGPVTLTEGMPLSWIAPVSVRCRAVRRATGTLPNVLLRNAGVLITRLDGASERAWSTDAEDWVPLSDLFDTDGASEAADIGALEPVDDDPAFPWRGTVALADPERYERGLPWPRYAVRCYFEATETIPPATEEDLPTVVEYFGLSARSAAVPVPDESPFLAGIEIEEETEEPKFIRMYLRAPGPVPRGEVQLQREDSPEGVLIRSLDGTDERARLFLAHDRRIELETAGARIRITDDGDVEVLPAAGRAATVHGVVVSRASGEVRIRPRSSTDTIVLDANVRVTGQLDVDGPIYEDGDRVRTFP